MKLLKRIMLENTDYFAKILEKNTSENINNLSVNVKEIDLKSA